MSKSKEGENLVAEVLLNGKVYDTRNLPYDEISEKSHDIEQKTPSQKSYIKFRFFLDKGTELREFYINKKLKKIPFDNFIENGNDAYFVEVKTKIKSESKKFVYAPTQWIGMVAANKCKIPVYIILLHAHQIDLKEYVPEFELLEIGSYKMPRSIYHPNQQRKYIENEKMLNNKNIFEFVPCNKETCEKVIKEEYLDLII